MPCDMHHVEREKSVVLPLPIQVMKDAIYAFSERETVSLLAILQRNI